MEACGLGPNPNSSHEAATGATSTASSESQAEETYPFPSQSRFRQPVDSMSPSIRLPDAPPLPTAFPFLFPPHLFSFIQLGLIKEFAAIAVVVT